jgi:hypothetical protein
LQHTLQEAEQRQYYGASFSPNSQLLYISTGWYGYPGLYQLDVTGATAADIVASRTVLVDPNDFDPDSSVFCSALQMGPDGRMYIATLNGHLDLIEEPNSPGPDCGYVRRAIPLRSCTFSEFGLPNYVESLFHPDQFFAGEACPPDSVHAAFTYAAEAIPLCMGTPVSFQDLSTCYPEAVERWAWAFDDPGAGALDSSSVQHPVHAFTSSGIHVVRLIAGIRLAPFHCKSDTTYANIAVMPCTNGIMDANLSTAAFGSPEAAIRTFQQQAWPAGSMLTLTDATGRLCVQAGAPDGIDQLQAWQAMCPEGLYLVAIILRGMRHTAKWMLVR